MALVVGFWWRGEEGTGRRGGERGREGASFGSFRGIVLTCHPVLASNVET